MESSVQQLTRFGFECRYVKREDAHVEQLVFLAPFALSTSAANMSIGEVLKIPTLCYSRRGGARGVFCSNSEWRDGGSRA